MHRPWSSLIAFLSEITRKNCDSIVCCTHCGDRYTNVKWGFYCRYLYDDELMKIQRYRCDNDQCPCKTFSILPHAFLPIVRASLSMLTYILKMYEQGNSIASIARHTGSNWPRMQRWIVKAISIREWLKHEYGSASSLCLSQSMQWSSFTREFSWVFYPNRTR